MGIIERDKMINEINKYRRIVNYSHGSTLPAEYKLWLWEQTKIRFEAWKADPFNDNIPACVMCKVFSCTSCLWAETNGLCLADDYSDTYSIVCKASEDYTNPEPDADTEALRNRLNNIMDDILKVINEQIEKYTSELEKESAK